VAGVEHLSNKDGVDLSVTLDKILALADFPNANLLGLIDHLIVAFGEVILGEGRQAGSSEALFGTIASGLVELVEHVGHRLTVGNILTQVGDAAFLAGLLEVVVHPSDEDIFGLQLVEVFHALVLVLEAIELGAILQVDVLHSEEATKLNEDTEDHALVLVGERSRVDTDQLEVTLGSSYSLLDVDPDRDGVHVVGILVDGAHVDGVLVNKVEELDEEESISHVEENIFGVGVDRETLGDFGIFIFRKFSVDQ